MYKKNINFSKLNIYGFVPARMAATRFPGKPLKKDFRQAYDPACIRKSKKVQTLKKSLSYYL